MGRRRSIEPKEKRRKKVTVQLLAREHAGKVTEPYEIMETALEKYHERLADAKLCIAWRLGWRPDPDGHLRLGQCKKRGDLDRELDGFDFVLLLNKEAWATLAPKAKAAVIDHELCHAEIVIDSDGQPKRDDRGRLVCRIRKHDIEDFRQVVRRHGCWTSDLADAVKDAIAHDDAPGQKLLPMAMREEPEDISTVRVEPSQGDSKPRNWKLVKVTSIPGIGEKYGRLLAESEEEITTAGRLQAQMQKYGLTWNCGIKGIGHATKEAIENAFNEWIMANATEDAAAKIEETLAG